MEFEARYAQWARAWPVDSEPLLLDTTCGRTFARVSGRASDPPLVLLPGARGTSLMWVPMIAALSACYRTYALDTITDMGLSVPNQPFSTVADLLGWLDEVLDVLAPGGRVDLVGCSYGGWLAAQYALHAPARLRKLALLAPGATVLRTSFRFMARVLLQLARLPGQRERAFRRTLRWLFADTVASGEDGRVFVEHDLLEWMEMGRLFALPRVIWPSVLDDASWQRLAVPCLFVVGENEKIYSAPAAVRRLQRVAPAVRTRIIPGAGHDLTFIQPDLVARTVLEFLREPAPVAAPALERSA